MMAICSLSILQRLPDGEMWQLKWWEDLSQLVGCRQACSGQIRSRLMRSAMQAARDVAGCRVCRDVVTEDLQALEPRIQTSSS